jgi:hypothetical protein
MVIELTLQDRTAILLFLFLLSLGLFVQPATSQSDRQIINDFHVGGDGGWD